MGTFADRLRNTRLLRKMSQSALAKEAGVSQPTIANWEAGSQHPRPAKLAALADALGVSTSWLMDGVHGDGGSAADYLSHPIRHVPVFAWPPSGESLDRYTPQSFVPIATDAEMLFALASNGDQADPGAILVFEESDEPEGGSWLVLAGTDHLLVKALKPQHTPIARLHTTIVTH